MRDAATLLLALVDAANVVITRPASAGTSLPELEALRVELDHASAMHADPKGGLLIDVEALLLAQVLCMVRKQQSLNDEHRADLLLQLAGVLLPELRGAVWRAITVRRDTRATT